MSAVPLVDFILLLPGQSYMVTVTKDDAEKLWNELIAACTPDDKNMTKLWFTLRENTGRVGQFKIPSICGWYIKEHSTSLQERVLKKMDKTLDQQTESDSWKHSDEDDPLT